MKIRFAVSLTWLLLLVQAYPAMATWGSFVSLGSTTVNSDVSCTASSGGQAVCAASGFTNALLVNQFNGSTWSGWTKLAGAISSAPSCASDGNGHVVCVARASNGGMVATVFNGTAWSAEVKLKASLASAPSCATLGGGRVLCAARSVTGALTSSVFNGTTWSAFDNQAETLTSGPGCGSDDAGRVVCAMNDTSSNVVVNRYNGTGWDGFLNLGGRATGEPTCTNIEESGQVVCFARGTDSSLNGNRFNGQIWVTGNWLGWGFEGGLIGPKGSCAVITTNQLVCGVFGVIDSALWVNEFTGTQWTGFQRLGQTTVGSPSCTTLGGGKVLCTAVGVNSKVSSIVGP